MLSINFTQLPHLVVRYTCTVAAMSRLNIIHILHVTCPGNNNWNAIMVLNNALFGTFCFL